MIHSDSKNKINGIINVYRRIIKYPCCALQRKKGPMMLKHHSKNGTVTVQAPEYVTTEDFEKLYIVLMLAQQKKCKVEETEYTIHIETNMKDIAAVINSNNYPSIFASLERLAKITVKYNFYNVVGILHVLDCVEWNKQNGKVKININKNFFDLCRMKFLSLNCITYTKLSPAARNIYCFLISNSQNTYNEEILIERGVIQCTRRDNARRLLKQALDDLVQARIIQSYKVKKSEKGYMYKIVRTNPQR